MRPVFGGLACLGEEFGLDPARGKMSKAKMREDFWGRHLSSSLSSAHKGSKWSAPMGAQRHWEGQEGPGVAHRAACLHVGTAYSNLLAAKVKTSRSHCPFMSSAGTSTHAPPYHALLLPWYSAEWRQKWNAGMKGLMTVQDGGNRCVTGGSWLI